MKGEGCFCAARQRDRRNLTNTTGESFLLVVKQTNKQTIKYAIYPCALLRFLRYHNGTLLDKKIYKYDEDLLLRDLKPEQSGEYYCKTSSLAGSIKSKPSVLTVIGM